MNNKKGISAVVATVLIILITVAAVTIIWAAVIPMIKDNLTSSDECLTAQAQVSLGTGGYTCIVDDATGNISIQIGHGPADFELASLQLIISVGGNTYSETLSSGLPGANQEKVFSVENVSYAGASKVEIAPTIKVGATQKACGIAQSYTLVECAN